MIRRQVLVAYGDLNPMMNQDILRDADFDCDEDHMMKCIQARSFENQYKRKPGDTDNYSHG